MPSYFAAIDHRSSPPRMISYQGSGAFVTGASFSTAETTNLSEKGQAPRIAQFGPNQHLFAFVGDGVYKTEDGAANWTQVYVPSNLSAADARRFGPLVLYLDDEPHLCICWVGTSGVQIARSKDGIDWEESNPFPFSRTVSGLTNLAVHGTVVYCSPVGNDVQCIVQWFDFKTLTGGQAAQIFFGGPETGSTVIHNDRVFWIMFQDGTSPDRVQLFEILGGSTPTLLATLTTTLNGSDGGAAWSSNGRIYYVARGTTGLQMYRTSTDLTTIEEITSSGVPSDLQANTNATVSKILVESESLVPNPELYVRNSGDVWDVYQWNSGAERLELYRASVGSTLHSLPCLYSVTGAHLYNPSAPRVDILRTETTIEGIKIYFKLYGEKGNTQSANISINYATDALDLALLNAATLVSASAGTISGNSVTGLSADNGATLYTVVWDIRADGYDPNTRFKLIGSILINRPILRRKKRKRWYKF